MRVEVGGVNGTETNVTGLTPFVYYTFSVTAENAVSSQDININARTVRVTAITEEGGMSHTYLTVQRVRFSVPQLEGECQSLWWEMMEC